jgi:cyclopropane fatty-acyl-phospholipid synthase-like methyltransferase
MASSAEERDWRAEFEQSYAGPPSAIAEPVWRDVFGDKYPAGLDPYSAVSMSELERIVDEVGVGHGETMVDIGCGRGGPSLWVAMATGAGLIGIVHLSRRTLVVARAH